MRPSQKMFMLLTALSASRAFAAGENPVPNPPVPVDVTVPVEQHQEQPEIGRPLLDHLGHLAEERVPQLHAQHREHPAVPGTQLPGRLVPDVAELVDRLLDPARGLRPDALGGVQVRRRRTEGDAGFPCDVANTGWHRLIVRSASRTPRRRHEGERNLLFELDREVGRVRYIVLG